MIVHTNGNIHNKHANEKIIKNLKISFSYFSSFLKKMQSYAIIGNIYYSPATC